MLKQAITLGSISVLLLLAGCGASIKGNVRLVDANNNPVSNEVLEGIIVNIINTSAPIEEASHSVKTDKQGNFVSESGKVANGVYKVEAAKLGYLTETKTIDVEKSSESLVFELKKLPNSKKRFYRNEKSDQDKIVNPGEVNIQPPAM